jgi:hypothetical protein
MIQHGEILLRRDVSSINNKTDYIPEPDIDDRENNSIISVRRKLDCATLQAMDAAYLALQAAECESSILGEAI